MTESKLRVSDKMAPSQLKIIMEFLENNPNSAINKISTAKKITKKEARELVNLLRKLGFVSVKLENKIHLFSADSVFDRENFPQDVNKYIEMGKIILLIIEEASGKTAIVENLLEKIRFKTGKNVDEETFYEFVKILPKIKEGVIIYKCSHSGNFVIRVEPEKTPAAEK